MHTITAGSVTQFFLYDVADAIDLGRVRRLIDESAPARLAPKPATPPYVQYVNPPISFDGHVVGMGRIEEFDVRFKAFDYGVVSLALTAAIPRSWDQMLDAAPRWHDDPNVAAEAERLGALREIERAGG